MVERAQGAEAMACLRADQRRSGVEPDAGRIGYQRVGRETWVQRRVGDDKGVVDAGDEVAAEGHLSRRALRLQPNTRGELLPIPANE